MVWFRLLTCLGRDTKKNAQGCIPFPFSPLRSTRSSFINTPSLIPCVVDVAIRHAPIICSTRESGSLSQDPRTSVWPKDRVSPTGWCTNPRHLAKVQQQRQPRQLSRASKTWVFPSFLISRHETTHPSPPTPPQLREDDHDHEAFFILTCTLGLRILPQVSFEAPVAQIFPFLKKQ